MRRVEVWVSDDGNLERRADRAKAHDLHNALPASSTYSNVKVLDWHACLHIVAEAVERLKRRA
ncbi:MULTISPECIES: hypothetical protein [unclassified Shinella]|uniref:hypothetical protein n=1 Tax=unclassified Shinella TaxID=2643062 RepID=UPI00225CEDB7|nr:MULTISPECIES: hypothetical protein [unclassified Shinella]MCO5138980.1 hypothetical protein [Shinella sp.]MDC7256291.1 hypothetical protein [Shinella sp. YE25]CAI0339149.1 hypothetical protein SHINE37_43003 [Rhizobiaceae bacterium]